MIILDKECEKILKKAIDYENTNRSKNQNKLEIGRASCRERV